MHACRVGGLEKLRDEERRNQGPELPKMECQSSKMEPWRFQNGALGLLKWSLGPPNLLQVNQKSTRMVVWRLLATPREPSRALGSGLGAPRAAKVGAKGPQDCPKASQNGVNMGSK